MESFDSSWSTSREELKRVAVHIVARARAQETGGRFSLRVTPGGFGTPEYGERCRQLRISGDSLIVSSDAPGEASATSHRLGDETLASLARIAGVDLDAPLDVGHDTPPVGDSDAKLAIDTDQADRLAQWYRIGQEILDQLLLAAKPKPCEVARLWPEHFDLAVVVKHQPDDGINFGASPGDSYSEEPYLYVGPWSSQRPGDPDFWNAPFGATMTWTQLGDNPVAAGLAFMAEGLDRLS